jgi:hypothetical protein
LGLLVNHTRDQVDAKILSSDVVRGVCGGIDFAPSPHSFIMDNDAVLAEDTQRGASKRTPSRSATT